MLHARFRRKVVHNNKATTQNEKEIITKPTVYKFHPFDAGLFANFNFVMARNAETRIVLPYWTNKSIGIPKKNTSHYNYWSNDENENIFLRYFDILINVTDIASLPRCSIEGDKNITEIKPRNHLMRNITAFTDARKKYNAIYKRLFRPKDSIMADVNKFMHDKQNAIAVHVRNLVHDVEARPLRFTHYFDAIARIDDGVRKIVLATDNDLALLVFKDKFGDRLAYFPDSQRSSIDMHLQWVQSIRRHKENSTGLINGKGYEVHNHSSAKESNHDMAFDVVFEMLCLQQAAHFIGSVSNVAMVVGYMNPELPMTIL